MPKIVKPLSDIQIKNAKPRDKSFCLFDGQGLFLEVTPLGTKLWRMKFTQPSSGKSNKLSFGSYPEVSLQEAREKRLEARKLIAKGIDPAHAKKEEQLASTIAAENTFEVIAREWLANKDGSWQDKTAANVLLRLEKDVFPAIGSLPITEIKVPVLLNVIRRIENRGAIEMARRQNQVCGQIFRYAIATGRAEADPTPQMRGALKSTTRGHHAAITVDELPDFIRAFEKIEGRMFAPTRIMFRLMMLTFVRTNELTATEWSEVDLINDEWVIPWQRMKMGKKKLNPRKENHHVFLPKQGWALMRELHEITGNNKYLFPNQRDHERPATDFGICRRKAHGIQRENDRAWLQVPGHGGH